MTPASRRPGYRSKYLKMKRMGYEFLVDATGTRRRLEALQCLGWSLTEVGELIGSTQQNMSYLATKRKRVYTETARKIAEVYDDLCMTPNSTQYAERTRVRARQLRYPSPLAWEGIDIDDPSARPEGVVRK